MNSTEPTLHQILNGNNEAEEPSEIHHSNDLYSSAKETDR